MKAKANYSKPTIEEYGAVESLTTELDKVGDAEDGVDFDGLDGSIVPDSET